VSSGDGDVAVLTGDLVGSRALPDEALDRARAALEAAARDAAGWEPALVAGGGLEFFRGDSWQLCLLRPTRLLRVALFLRARLRALGRGFDTRIGVGLGPVARLDPERVSRSTGLAFERSGAALDRMKRRERLAVNPDGADPELRIVATLCAAIADRWTPAQARAMAQAVGPDPAPDQSAMAARLVVSQSAVAQALRAAGFEPLRAALDWFESFISE
jgi:hypothetical protein